MLKKIMLIFILTLSLFASQEEGNSDKGLTYYKFIILPIIKIKGSRFTKYHSSEEWKVLFKNDAKEFKMKYEGINEEFKQFLTTEKFNKIRPHIEAFFVNYSKDSGHSPNCGE